METPKRQTNCNNNDNDHDNDAATTATVSSPTTMGSPKTPVRSTLDDSLDDDYDTDDMESPQFPHLLPVYHRRTSNEYDLEGVRIGWDDGCGSVFFQDDDYRSEKNSRRLRRSNSLFSIHRGSLFGPQKRRKNSSPPRSTSKSNAVIQAELNDYLACILRCLSAKKRDRQLLKLQNDAKSVNNSVENNVVKNLLNDSADDEMLMLCSQAIEKTIATDSNYNTMDTVDTNLTKANNTLSIVGISPLKDTDNTINNNVFHHTAKKLKSVHCKRLYYESNESVQSQSHVKITENKQNHENRNSTFNTNINYNKDDSLSLLLNNSLDNEDDLFSSIDLSAIESQILSSGVKKTTPVKQKHNQDFINTNKFKNVTSTCTSSTSLVNKQFNLQQDEQLSSVAKGNSSATSDTKTRYCTPAEIEAKQERARRTLMLKFKSRNKSAM